MAALFGYLRRHIRGFIGAALVKLGFHDPALARYVTWRYLAYGLFMASGRRLDFTPKAPPICSILMTTYGKAALTLASLRSIRTHADGPYELIIVDNGSGATVQALLGRLQGAIVIRNKTNRGYGPACNQAAAASSSALLLLINNDAELLSGSLAAAREALASAPDIGAVCGMILNPNGRLQEAGCALFDDGSAIGYGRGDDPDRSLYLFRRPVAFGSGCLLLTPRAVWGRLGGFDERFFPVYYEDVDYCVRLADIGLRVLYEPRAIAIHAEYSSSGSQTAAERAIALQHKVFCEKHGARLHRYPTRSADSLRWRSAGDRKKVLVIDDRVPHDELGTGLPRTAQILRALADRGYEVAYLPTYRGPEPQRIDRATLPREVEFVVERGDEDPIRRHLGERPSHYDLWLVSRPHNMERLQRILKMAPTLRGHAALLYDAEAIFALRSIERGRLLPKHAVADPEAAIAAEIALTADAEAITAVSAREAALLGQRSSAEIACLGYPLRAKPTPHPFDARRDMLFVGPLLEPTTPNADSILWFATYVLPRLRGLAGDSAAPRLICVGDCRIDDLKTHPDIDLVGKVADLAPYFDRARIFVAPTRFSAGLPIKLLTAAAYGVPAVATPPLVAQLGWQDGRDILAAPAEDGEAFAAACWRLYNDSGLWQNLRANALRRIEQEHDPEEFADRLAAIVESAIARRRQA